MGELMKLTAQDWAKLQNRTPSNKSKHVFYDRIRENRGYEYNGFKDISFKCESAAISRLKYIMAR